MSTGCIGMSCGFDPQKNPQNLIGALAKGAYKFYLQGDAEPWRIAVAKVSYTLAQKGDEFGARLLIRALFGDTCVGDLDDEVVAERIQRTNDREVGKACLQIRTEKFAGAKPEIRERLKAAGRLFAKAERADVAESVLENTLAAYADLVSAYAEHTEDPHIQKWYAKAEEAKVPRAKLAAYVVALCSPAFSEEGNDAMQKAAEIVARRAYDSALEGKASWADLLAAMSMQRAWVLSRTAGVAGVKENNKWLKEAKRELEQLTKRLSELKKSLEY